MKLFWPYLWLTFSAWLIIGCAAGEPSGTPFNLQVARASGSPVERRIVARHRDMAALNARLGYAQARLLLNDEATLRQFTRVIARRIEGDLVQFYGRDLQASDRNFALLERSENLYNVFVVRVRNISVDGAYVELDGLAYRFRRGESEPDFVSPTGY